MGSFDHCNTSRTRPNELTLVLRRWHELHESNEFRCFVRDSKLVAISQRQTSGFFEHLTKPEEATALHSVIQDFFDGHICDEFSLSRYVFDIYVDVAPRRRVWLVDFSPWGSTTDPCLFDWDEITQLGVPSQAELRVVQSQAETKGKLERYHNLPLELANLNSKDGLDGLLEAANKIMKEKEKQEKA